MKAFMTNGTIDFLLKLDEKHKDIPFHFMTSNSNGLAYYEGNKKSVFSAGREYEILIEKGDILDDGYVVMNNIPVIEDGQASFEARFKKRGNDVDMMPGFQAFRFLKPRKGHTYVVFTQWQSEQDFENWKNSEQFKQSHNGQATKPPAYYADKPFITTYHMFDKG
ncbi:heme-degrading monooxygenase HmoB [Oceanobacillus picturae]|uniref:Heme-degrading monooxygenase HmoB n=1 Tax=Oceanobacillus picturae TaxID=171693 RepID=A0A0U9HCS3_9BACI|nr:antibiotic biosynthesis monooxygenase [Oceanobacillus picturae]GAQ19625.1 heme-degrading monooxygenase HmoB [Oceanobacillus picturae]